MNKFEALNKLKEVQQYLELVSASQLSESDKEYALEHLERVYLTIQRIKF